MTRSSYTFLLTQMDPAHLTPLLPPSLPNQNDSTNTQNDAITTNSNNINTTINNKRGISIAERRAAKCGFKAERIINTVRFTTGNSGWINSPLSSPVISSPLITIPPGISPTALLDSPVLWHNSQASPTTGTVPFPLKVENDLDDALLDFSSLFNQRNNGDLQSIVSVGPPRDIGCPLEFPKETTARVLDDDLFPGPKITECKIIDTNCGLQVQCPDPSRSTNRQLKEPAADGESVGAHSAEERKESFPAADMGRTSEDGYNWRKYGQKQVKSSKNPRIYYKCSHPNCQVRKKIGCSLDGQITQVIYKGAHNHPKPQSTCRAAPVSASSFGEHTRTDVKPEGGTAWWKCLEPGSKDVNLGSDRSIDRLERTSSASVVTEVNDPVSSTKRKFVGAFESAGTPELSFSVPSFGDNDDYGTTQGSISVRGEAVDEESESRRRRLKCSAETKLTSRAVREPRVVVQIESDVDILDDGYRWRKYGQKVVKGNPNPRSYYKCTTSGCSVRKHVERAPHDLKFVITTYEGKHNHEVPAVKNSSNANSSCADLPQNPSNAQHGLALGRNSNGPKPELHIHDFGSSFDRNLRFHNHLRPSFPGNFSNDARLRATSIHSVKFPSIQNTMPYGPVGCNSNPAASHHSGSMASLVPYFPISGHSSRNTPSNLSFAAVDFQNRGKVVGPMQPFLSGQQPIWPKLEQKDDIYEVGPSKLTVPMCPPHRRHSHCTNR